MKLFPPRVDRRIQGLFVTLCAPNHSPWPESTSPPVGGTHTSPKSSPRSGRPVTKSMTSAIPKTTPAASTGPMWMKKPSGNAPLPQEPVDNIILGYSEFRGAWLGAKQTLGALIAALREAILPRSARENGRQGIRNHFLALREFRVAGIRTGEGTRTLTPFGTRS